MFVCGPTVQDNIHLGHAKTYIAFDVLTRWLLKCGNKVFFLMNITDVDDKIFDRAKRENVPYMKIANRFFEEFVEDLESLNILTVSKFCRVSQYIEQSAILVRRLLDMGIAYRLNGNVYFDISKADHFGKLSHQTEYDLKLKQIDAAPGKRNSVDFLLWRKVDSTEGVWNYASIGEGRPGWHIQDTAIAFDQFSGNPYDLHGGATELIFPHHEAELSQDEALSGKIPFVSIWMHTGLLLENGEKMSKSLGNVLTVRSALRKFTSDELRYYFLSHHYRESFDLNLEEISHLSAKLRQIEKASRIVLPRSSESQRSSRSKLQTLPSRLPKTNKLVELLADFAAAMDDDLNTPQALEILYKLSESIVEKEMDSKDANEEISKAFWHMVDSLGFVLL
jgi:cysteinyl-tRNA synthetase